LMKSKLRSWKEQFTSREVAAKVWECPRCKKRYKQGVDVIR